MGSKDPHSEGARRVRALAALLPFVRPYRGLIVAACCVLMVTAAIALTIPVAVRQIVDGFDTSEAKLHNRYFLFAFGVVVLLAIGSSLRNYLTKLLAERVVVDIRKAVFSRMIYMSPAFFERTLTGEVLSRMTADTTLILSAIGNMTSMALRHTIMFAGGFVLLFLTSPKLTGMIVLVVPLVMVPIIGIGRRVRANAKDNQEWIAASSGSASEALLAAPVVQAYTAETRATETFDAVTDRALASATRVVTSHAWMNGIVIMMVFVGVVTVVWAGAQDVRAGEITVGELVQFVFYSVIVATSVAAFSDIWGETQRAAGAAERLIGLVNAEDTVQDPPNPVDLPEAVTGHVVFENVKFHYPTRPSVAALDGVTLEIQPGETVALVGPSGAGKSTMLQLLMRFYDPTEGQISIDGVRLTDMRRSDYRQSIALVPQDPVMFAVSARQNIRFGHPGADDADVEAAAKSAAAHAFLSDLPEGYDTFIGEQGVMLSGGQKQRIAIARAILRDAPILLLDEATSALDAESESAIQAAVQDLSVGRTTLIIAHRLATVKMADRIVVFEGGKIVAQGTHDELIAEGGLYARLAKLQFVTANTDS